MKRKMLISLITTHDAEDLILEYLLYNESIKKRSCYSLKIIETYKGSKETVYLEDITDNRESAVSLIYDFSSNSVTPCTAMDILADIFPI